MDVIASANSHFPNVQVATNGITFIPEGIHPGSIWLSIDGPELIHNKIRNSKQNFQKLKANYQDDNRVLACSTISTSNYQYIEDIINIALGMNLKGIVFMIYSGNKRDDLLPSPRIFNMIISKLTRMVDEYEDFMLITKDMIQAYNNKDLVRSCPFLGKRPSILSFYANMNRKRCFMGDHVDCSTCSCLVPVGAYVLQHHLTNIENYRKIQKILQ